MIEMIEREKQEYKQLGDEIVSLFQKRKVKGVEEILTFLNDLYSIYETIYIGGDETDKQWACREAYKEILSRVEVLLSSGESDEQTERIYSLYRKVYAFISRRSFAHFIDFMEWERTEHNKIWYNRQDVLKPFVWYLNKAMFDEKLKMVICSYPPGYGKSFVINYFCAWVYGVRYDSSILRVSYSDDLVTSFSRMIKELISNQLFSEIFPDFKRFNGKPFDKTSESDWKLRGADVLMSHLARTRDGQITGARANAAICFDDLTKGVNEATNVDIHKNLYNQWKSEWVNRRTNASVLFVFAGTMWSPEDIINRIIEDEEKKGDLLPSTHFPYCRESVDGTSVVIQVPLLDEDDITTCEHVMSTKDALFLRDTTDEYFFSCVYQQRPIAPSGMEFAWENLKTYVELPDDLPTYSEAALDPARKGKNYVSMPILKLGEDGLYYLVDTLYEKKAMDELYDAIIDKVVEHRITILVVESNVDTSLKYVLETKLDERGLKGICKIMEKFATKNKEQRINAARTMMTSRIVYPSKARTTPRSNKGRFMQDLTHYSFDYPNKFDDAPDSLALFCTERILGADIYGTALPISRRGLGL